MKVLVTGAKGQLGYDIVKCLENRQIECVGVGREEFDITDFESTNKFIMQYAPDVIVHCAAYSKVDKAEEEQGSCYDINVRGTKNIAEISKNLEMKMVFISTDYVFSGFKNGVYEVDDITNPLSVYGKSKDEGEKIVKDTLNRHFIIRTSWLFGKNGNNFINTILKIAQTRENISVVNDQIGSPTYTVDLAGFICELILTNYYGVYHVTNEGFCSWAELAQEVIRLTRLNVTVNPVTSEAYNSAAKRPKNSRLSKRSINKIEHTRLPIWKDALCRYLREINTI